MKLKYLVLAILSALLVGGVVLFNDIFPKTAPIRCPEADSIVSVVIGSSDSDGTVVAEGQDIEKLLALLENCKPTRKQALDDYPTARPWYKIEIQTADGSRCIFVYQTGGQTYAECPYEGIYKAKDELFDTVFDLLS